MAHKPQLNLKYLRTNTWIPLKMTDDSVEVLNDDPYAFEKLQDIKRVFPGKQLKSIVGLKEDILKYVDAIAASLTPQPVEPQEQPEQPEQPESEALEELTIQAEPGTQSTPPIPQEVHRHTQDKTHGHRQLQIRGQAEETFIESTLSEDSGAVVRLVKQIIEDACRERASDIHIEPEGEEHETRIRLRIDGYCYDYRTLPASARKPLVSRLKVMAQLDIAERRRPQEGKMKVSLPDGDVEVRVTTLPTTGIANEDVVLRILTSSEKRSFDQLQMTPRNQEAFHELLTKPSGLILCVGPTGTGKTTTLHAALETINTPQRKIWTAEDPVEITQRGLRQLQVQPKIGLTFATAIRSLLRADPDVIMIGEIRDRETTEVCIDAALTGHLVLSTLHTNNATETVSRLLEMGMDPFTFADTLLGVVAQRLARTICHSCKESYHPLQDEYDALAYGYGETAFAQLNIAYDDQFMLYRGSGCEACRNTGYKGRVGLHELLVATDEIKTGIRTRSQPKELFHTATTQGMTTLIQDGILKVLQGWTDYNQVKAVASR
jgi:type II secretory ATPase GspE/PulE/Tfp pilus assembly ATPase PilB-like protein